MFVCAGKILRRTGDNCDFDAVCECACKNRFQTAEPVFAHKRTDNHDFVPCVGNVLLENGVEALPVVNHVTLNQNLLHGLLMLL